MRKTIISLSVITLPLLSACHTVTSSMETGFQQQAQARNNAGLEPEPPQPPSETTNSQMVNRTAKNSGLSSLSNQSDNPGTAGSLSVNPTEYTARIARGLTYFMPKQLLRVTVKKTDLILKKQLDSLVKTEGQLAALKKKILPVNTLAKKIELQIKALPAGSKSLGAMQTDLAKAKGEQSLLKGQIDKAAAKAKTIRGTIALARPEEPKAGTKPAETKKQDYALTVEQLPLTADSSMRFTLDPRHNPFRDDETKFAISKDGLLSSADIITTDRTADIIVEIASAIAAATGNVVGTSSESISCKKAVSRITRIIDPAIPAEIEALNKYLQPCFGTRITYGENQFIAKPVATTLNRKGIFYRTAVPLTLNFERNMEEGWIAIDSKTIIVPQAGPMAYIPATASAFVKTTNNMKFKDGMLINWDNNRPSELAEIVRTPMRVINGGFDAISKVLQLKIDTSQKEKELTTAEREALLESERSNILLECLNAATEADISSEYCLE